MLKFVILIAFAAAASAQYAAPPSDSSAEVNGAPEPYSYGYETDTHAAAEQRDPSGKVTGYYTLVDTDGRQRRVEYVADEAGFRAKVQTNEVGTKSENSADVEVSAAPPTKEQLVYQPAVQQQSVAVQQVPRVVSQPVVGQVQQGARYQYVQQPGYSYGYYPGYQYGRYSQYGTQYGPQYGVQYGTQYGTQYGASYPYGYGYYSNGVYGGYNNQLPSQYYKSVSTTGRVAQYSPGSTVSQYVSNVPVVSSVSSSVPSGVSYQSRSYQTIGVPASSQGVSYQTVGVQPVGYQARSASLQGSSNYIVLKKRESLDSASKEVLKRLEKAKEKTN